MDDFNKLISGTTPVLVDFHATWCGPCKMQGPILEQVKKALGDDAHIIKIDVDKATDIAQRYRVQSVPTLIIFVGGEAVWRGVGVHQADVLEAKLREHIGGKQ